MSEKSIAFAHSQTRENLMRAFAGESQARSRYTIAAGIAHKSGLEVIQGLFLFTADQEKAHAKEFYRQLHELGGQTVRVDGTYPVDLYADLLDYLRAAQHNEYQEWEHDYAGFARTAMEEGFPLVGKLFENIAHVEKLHGERFGRFGDLLEQGKLFSGQAEQGWLCLNCGHIHQGPAAPAVCPVCGHNQGFFLRLENAPFGIPGGSC